MTAYCALCGNRNKNDLGKVIGICLDKAACHAREAARRNARLHPDDGVIAVSREHLREVLAAAYDTAGGTEAFASLADAAGLVR